MEVTHGRGYVYSIQYHIVWCVKYRHKILTPQVENKLVEILNTVFKKKLWCGYLWNLSYFVATVSENTEEQIRKYIKNQKRKRGEVSGESIQVSHLSK